MKPALRRQLDKVAHNRAQRARLSPALQYRLRHLNEELTRAEQIAARHAAAVHAQLETLRRQGGVRWDDAEFEPAITVWSHASGARELIGVPLCVVGDCAVGAGEALVSPMSADDGHGPLSEFPHCLAFHDLYDHQGAAWKALARADAISVLGNLTLQRLISLPQASRLEALDAKLQVAATWIEAATAALARAHPRSRFQHEGMSVSRHYRAHCRFLWREPDADGASEEHIALEISSVLNEHGHPRSAPLPEEAMAPHLRPSAAPNWLFIAALAQASHGAWPQRPLQEFARCQQLWIDVTASDSFWWRWGG